MLDVISSGTVKGRTDLVYKASTRYGKIQSLKSIIQLLANLKDRGLVEECEDNSIRITEEGLKLLGHVNAALKLLGDD